MKRSPHQCSKDNQFIVHRRLRLLRLNLLDQSELVYSDLIIARKRLLSKRKESKKALTNAFATFPQMRFVVEDLVAEGDKVALRVTIHGVPTPPGEPLPLIMEIFRLENGRVAEIWGAGTLRRPAA